MPRALRLLACLASFVPCTQAANVTVKDLAPYYAPERMFNPSLSPDGRHLAYLLRTGPVFSIVVRDADHLENKTSVFADAAIPLAGSRGKPGFLQVTFHGWIDNEHLLYLAQRPWSAGSAGQELHCVNERTGEDRVLLTSEDVTTFAEATFNRRRAEQRLMDTDVPDLYPEPLAPVTVNRQMNVVGLGGTDVWVEARGGWRTRTGVYRVSLTGGEKRQVGLEESGCVYLYDGTGLPRLRATSPLPDSTTPGTGLLGVPMRAAGAVVTQYFQVRLGNASRWRDLDDCPGGAGLNFRYSESDPEVPRSIPLGFGTDPNLLYVASNVGQPAYRVFTLNLATGARLAVTGGDEARDVVVPVKLLPTSPLLRDRHGAVLGVCLRGATATVRWFDPALADLQARLAPLFPERTVELLNWNDAKTRAVAIVQGPGAPRRVFLVETTPSFRCTEFFRDNTALTADRLVPARTFAFTTPAGVRLVATLTTARRARVTPAPLVVLCRDPAQPTLSEDRYNPDAQALAAAGFNVLDVAYRGCAGFGTAHRTAVLDGLDRVPLEDIRAALKHLAGEHPFDRRRVALVGRGMGGFIALRGVELYPAEFRGAVAVSAPTDLARWTAPRRTTWQRTFLDGSRVPLAAVSVLAGAAALERPVLLIADPADGATAVWHSRELRDRLAAAKKDVEYVEARGAGAGTELGPAMVNRVQQFLNSRLFDYRVEVGEERPVE